jgi:hypothetical protein
VRGSDPLRGTFRFHPGVELVLYDRLDPAHQARVAHLTRDPGFYGLLVTASTTKAVDRDSALLLLTLRTPGPIPQYALRALGGNAGRTVAGLVLDGILEIEHEGVFRSGAAAVSLVGEASGDDAATGVIDRLSIDAVRYAASLPIRETSILAGRLYRYNQIPLTPRYQRAYEAESDDVRLGLAVPRAAAILARSWTRVSPTGAPWMSWIARREVDRPGERQGTYKLYVSPAVDAVRWVFPEVLGAVTSHRPFACKVGKGMYGLLRADKMVIYFARRDDLHGAASAVADALSGVSAQGVPFSSAITADGLLSWGIDPPDDVGLAGLLRSESWRERLTNQMAAALVGASPRGDGLDAVVRFVLRRLEAHGIDVRTWRPAS